MIVAVGNDGQFRRFCEILGRPEWGPDPAYATNAARVANRDVLVPLIEAITPTRTTKAWVEALEEAANVPGGPDQPDRRGVRGSAGPGARSADRDGPRRGAGRRRGWPARCGCRARRSHTVTRPPTLGQHTDDVLAQTLGLSAEEIAGLKGARRGLEAARERLENRLLESLILLDSLARGAREGMDVSKIGD